MLTFNKVINTISSKKVEVDTTWGKYAMPSAQEKKF